MNPERDTGGYDPQRGEPAEYPYRFPPPAPVPGQRYAPVSAPPAYPTSGATTSPTFGYRPRSAGEAWPGSGAGPQGFGAGPQGFGAGPQGFAAGSHGALAAPPAPPGYDAAPPGFPAAPPGFPAAPPGFPAAPPGFPAAPPGLSPAPPGFGAGPPGLPQAPQPRARRPRRRAVVAAAIAVLLVLVGGQAYLLIWVNQRLDAAEGRVAAADREARARAQALESRVGELQKILGGQFNPEAIASAVVPSVFRVSAGDAIGTAFAVGKNTASGGTNLFTNYHVVEEVYSDGGRQVFLERQDKRFPARIVGVDVANDVAHLQTTGKFAGLAMARAQAKAGQPIVVVGSPLGLDETVTTGVISAFRKVDDYAAEVIQFDASINPGNSGGPVINSAKQVVGIASAKARNAEGIGLAVSIVTACGKFKIC
jgi:putative serine protease PepD